MVIAITSHQEHNHNHLASSSETPCTNSNGNHQQCLFAKNVITIILIINNMIQKHHHHLQDNHQDHHHHQKHLAVFGDWAWGIRKGNSIASRLKGKTTVMPIYDVDDWWWGKMVSFHDQCDPAKNEAKIDGYRLEVPPVYWAKVIFLCQQRYEVYFTHQWDSWAFASTSFF